MLPVIDPKELAREPDWGERRCGYAHDRYATSFAELGDPIRLHRVHCWLLARRISATRYSDAVGPYPFFTCENVAEAVTEMMDLAQALVSVSLVLDPFSGHSCQQLEGWFELVLPFKTHYLVDLEVSFDRYLCRHHRRYAKRSLSLVEVEILQNASACSAEWAELYTHLIIRHEITGIRAFTPKALADQIAVPGCHYFRAIHEGSTVGALVCYLDRGVAYAHLISTTPLGQKLMAQYALYWTAIEYFRERARWFALGGVAGSSDGRSEGLAFFKRGWATATCQAFFCGKILNRTRYDELCRSLHLAVPDHFPAYRGGVYG
jgi:hypothetical protein